MSFKDDLRNWTDFDGAGFCLGVYLGFFKRDEFQKVKGLLWTQNSVSDALYDSLDLMVKCGILLKNDDEDQFKWGKNEQGRK